jgi:putative copper export protein
MASLPQIGLVFHIIGLTMIAGTTVSEFVMVRQFRKQYDQDKTKGFAVMQATSKLPPLTGIGLLLLIISGMTMVAASGGAYGQFLWFKIKMIVVLLIIATIILLRRGLEKRLHKLVSDDMAHGNVTMQVRTLASRVGYLQLSLLSFFVVIFILTAFRFN